MFRAFEACDPDAIRVILLGQEPYADPAWATGRAFEQGNLRDWPENRVVIADSLRRIVQVLASARTRNREYAAGDQGWKDVIRDLHSGRLNLEPPPALFDRLEREGVMFLNSSLTVSVVTGTTPKRHFGHFQMWAPVIYRVLSFVAGRGSGSAVFLLLGRHAQEVFASSRAQAAALSAGTWKRRVDTASHFHPAAITASGAVFFSPNPFLITNRQLVRMGAPPIPW